MGVSVSEPAFFDRNEDTESASMKVSGDSEKTTRRTTNGSSDAFVIVFAKTAKQTVL